jgi:hypothetical protein
LQRYSKKIRSRTKNSRRKIRRKPKKKLEEDPELKSYC